MPEQTPTTTQTAPATTQPAAPAQPAAPVTTTPAAPDNTQATLERYRQQIAGMQGYYERGKALGIQSDADWERVAQRLQPFNEPAPQPRQQQTPIDGGAGIDESQIGSIVDQRVAAAIAQREHAQAERESRSALESGVKQFLGTNASAADVKLYQAVAKGIYEEELRNSFYDDGHPLALKAFKPVSWDKVQARLAEYRNEVEAARLATIGTQAATARPGPGTIVGNSGGNGAPTDAGNRPFYQQTRAERMRHVEQIQARVNARFGGGMPASQAT